MAQFKVSSVLPVTPLQMPITVAIVEDNSLIRSTLTRVIAESGDCECVCTSGTAERALKTIPKHKPDVVLMDIELPTSSGIECTASLKRILPESQILILTVYNDNDQIFNALEAGASGYLLKRSSPEEIMNAVRDVHQGGSPMSSEIARKVVHHFRKPSVENPELRSL